MYLIRGGLMHYRFSNILLPIFLFAFFAGSAAGGEASCKPYNIDFGQKGVGWTHQPLSKLKRDTVYTLEQEGSGTVLHAVADSSASLYAALIKKGLHLPPILSWRWKTDALVPGADNRDKKREDAPLRMIVAFDGDKSTLPEVEQARFKRAKKLFGRDLPYAVLMYIWSEQVPVETVIPSAHTSQVKMLVASTGAGGLGKWQTVRRTFAEDYRRAFKADPGRVLGVAVMTDTDNTGSKAVGWYSNIRFECENR
jgi:Protein of unknown function (DUF3047)